MNIEIPDGMSSAAVLRRSLWIAFKASQAVGMGVLHMGAADAATEKSIHENAHLTEEVCDADYVFGRMVKLSLRSESGVVVTPSSSPQHDYQSWSSTYPTFEALVESAITSLQGEEAKP